MEKKIIQSLFANVVGKDDLRPIMKGVHFESERCYASDGHLLVIYEESQSKLDGKTMSADGLIIEGIYPKVDAVFPKKEDYGTKLSIDVQQLKDACLWHLKQEDSDDHDAVVINGVGYLIRSMARILNVMTASGNPQKVAFYNQPNRGAVFIGTKIKGMLMTFPFEESNVDSERGDECMSVVLSYENLINEYVFNSWKKPQKIDSLAWLD